MSELIQQAGMALSSGQFTEAMELFDQAREAEPDNAVAHYGWAEAAFMRLSMDMEEDVPAGKIMQVYKKAMQLDEENLEYVASFANFCLDCGRILWQSRNISVLRRWLISMKFLSKTHYSMLVD